MKTLHTPTPWKLDNEFNQIQSSKGETIVMSFGRTANKLDRELIVTAVNNHHALLEALKWTITFVRDLQYDEQKEIREQILALISKAESKS